MGGEKWIKGEFIVSVDFIVTIALLIKITRVLKKTGNVAALYGRNISGFILNQI